MDRFGKLVGATCAALLICMPAWAQDNNGPVTASADTADPTANTSPTPRDEIVVTAMKREAQIQDIGAAITAIGGDDVKLKNIDTGADLQFHVPNMVFSQISGTAQYTIRGIGLGVDSGLAEPGVAVHIDGAFIPRATQTVILAGDIKRVEVLRGPQGTLYGRNATGGVINFITNDPEEEFGIGATLGGAQFKERTASAYITGPLWSDKILFRIYGDYKQQNGHIVNVDNGRRHGDNERFNGRLVTRFNLTDDLSVDLTARYSERDVERGGGQVTDDPVGLFTDLGFVTTEPYKSKANDVGPTEQTVKGAALNITYQGAWFDVRTITSYIKEDFMRTTDVDGSNQAMFRSVNHQRSEAWSQEINVSGQAFESRLSWIGGVFGFQEDAYLDADNRGGAALDDLEDQLLGQVGLPIGVNDIIDTLRDRTIIAVNIEENRSLGAFADLTFNLLDDVRLIGGLRYSWDKKTSHTKFHNATADCEDTHTLTSKALSPKVAVEWDVNDDIMTYAQAQQGIKPGGVGVGDSTCSNVFKPENINSFEVGVKTNWWEDRITANLTGFSYYYDDYQSFQIVGLAAIVENADHARVDGAELELVAKPFPFLAMNLNATWMDARFTEFESTDPMATGLGRVFLGISPDPQDLSGKRMVRSPEYTLSGGIQVMSPLPNFIPVFDGALARIDAYWTDEITFRPYSEPFDIRESYTVMNGTVALTNDDRTVRLRAYVKNITDEVYVVSQFAFPIFATMLGGHGTPRTFGTTLNVSF